MQRTVTYVSCIVHLKSGDLCSSWQGSTAGDREKRGQKSLNFSWILLIAYV